MEHRTLYRLDILQTLPLAHGLFAANDHSVCVVDDAVADGVCQQRVRQLLRLARDVKLGAENRGVSLVPGLHDSYTIEIREVDDSNQKSM